MKRLGIRKVAAAAYNTKVVDKTDTAITKVVTLPGAILRKFADVTGVTKVHNKLKIDTTGKSKHKAVNQSINDKINAANQNLVMQDAKDLAAAKEFEREQAENLVELGIEMNVDLKNFASTRIPQENA